MLDKLPIEITSIIIDHLNQESLVALNLTSKKYNRLITPTFFKSVEVNSHKNLVGSTKSNTTRIASIYSLKVFFKTLVNDPHNCKLVQKLVFKNLPDVPEDTLVMYFEKVFPYLVNLTEFKWYSTYNLDLQVINLIPNTKLNKLNGNFKNFDHFNNNNFKNLKSLSLSGFKNFKNINIKLDVFKNLSYLKISKKNLVLVEDEIENLLTNVFPLNLLALNLENLYLTNKDIQVLSKKINFKYLKVLKLLNCYECYSDYENILSTINDQNKSLSTIEMNLLNNENNNQYIFEFLQNHTNIKSLKININTASNLSKEFHNLLIHLPPSTTNLDVDFCLKGIHNYQSLNSTNHPDIISQLNNFHHLQSLTIPVSLQGLTQLNLKLPNLHTLRLNLLDGLKLQNSLINVDHTQLSINHFNHVLSTIKCNNLHYLIIKLFDFHILNVKNKVFNCLPQLC